MGGLIFIPGVVAVVVSVIALVAAGRRLVPGLSTPGMASSSLEAVARARRRTVAWRLAGLLVGIAAGGVLAVMPRESLGIGAALAAPTFSLCLLCGVIVGELFGRAPTGVIRTATIEVRSPQAFLPRVMLWWVGGLGLVLVGFLLVTTAVGASDDMGRAGRAIAVRCGADLESAAGPWPGSFYSLPIGVAVSVGVLLAALAAWVVASRPRPQGDEAGRLTDDEVRRASGRTIVASVGVLLAAPLAGSAAFAGMALQTVGCGSTAMRVIGLSCVGLALLAGIATAKFLAVVLLRTTRSGNL